MATKIKSKGSTKLKKPVEPVVETTDTDPNDESDLNDSKDELQLADFKVEHPHLNAIRTIDPKNTCVFCKTYKVDEVNLGPLYSVDNATSHYFCMLFAAGLSQNGEDKQGILGFMPVDIEKEVRRAARLKCAYCHHAGAAVGCCDRKCKASFHYPCGLSRGVTYQFFGNYESYCINHSQKKEAPRKPAPDHRCPVCLHRISESQSYVSGNCCLRSIFHKKCIQRMALSAGYFFKCPTCNAAEKFREDMRHQGIFVPEQDAAWEREPNAFQDLLYQYSKCDADPCECPKGREYGCTKGPWMLARCRVCGAAGTHRLCSKSKSVAKWACASCLDIEARTDKEKKAVKPTKAKPKPKKSIPAPPEEVEDVPTLTPTPSTSAVAQKPSSTKTVPEKSSTKNKPTEEDDEDDITEEEIDVAKIYILPACRDYFPHNKAQLQELALTRYGILPDWRLQDLFVNLVDIFSDVEGLITAAQKVQTKEATAPKASVGITSTAPIPKSSGNRRKAGEKRSFRKVSQWQKGVVKKKRDKKPKDRTSAKQTGENLEETPLQLNSVAEKEPNEPQPSTSSQAILEGIRRSQSTLLRMATTSNDTPSPAIPGPSRLAKIHDDFAYPIKQRKLDERLRVKGNTQKRNDSVPDSTNTSINNYSDKMIPDSPSSSSSGRVSTNLVKSSSYDLSLNHKNLLEGAQEKRKNPTTISPPPNPEKSKTVLEKADGNHTTNTDGDQSLDSETSWETAKEMDSMDLDSSE